MKKSGISIFIVKFITFNIFGLILFIFLRYLWDLFFGEVLPWTVYLRKEGLWLIPLLPLYIYMHFKMIAPFKKDPNYIWYQNFFKVQISAKIHIQQWENIVQQIFPKAKLIQKKEEVLVFRLKSRPLSQGERLIISKKGPELYEFKSQSPWFNLLDFGVNYKNCYLFIQNLKKKT